MISFWLASWTSCGFYFFSCLTLYWEVNTVYNLIYLKKWRLVEKLGLYIYTYICTHIYVCVYIYVTHLNVVLVLVLHLANKLPSPLNLGTNNMCL